MNAEEKEGFNDLIKRNGELEDKVNELVAKVKNLTEAYNLLMDYWDSLPDEEKPELDRKLSKLGL